MNIIVRIAATVLAATLWAGSAVAAPCGVFTDVDSTHPFCPYVDWMRTRGISLGCTTTTYCPDAYVTRLQMAAFLNRMADALFPLDCATGQIMKWNGTAWACANDSNSPGIARALECARVFGTSASVPGNTYGYGFAATCPSGYTPTSSGIEAAAYVVVADSAISASSVTVYTYNLGASAQNVRAWAQCCRAPPP